MKPLVLRVASPCTESWDAMQPAPDADSERVRHCLKCKMNVFNLTSMSRAEIDALLMKAQGRVCARFYQRRDGTVLTRDCPVGLRKVRVRVAAALATALALVVAAIGWRIGGARNVGGAPGAATDLKGRVVAIKEELRMTKTFGPVIEWLDPTPPIIMGDIAAP